MSFIYGGIHDRNIKPAVSCPAESVAEVTLDDPSFERYPVVASGDSRLSCGLLQQVDRGGVGLHEVDFYGYFDVSFDEIGDQGEHQCACTGTGIDHFEWSIGGFNQRCDSASDIRRSCELTYARPLVPVGALFQILVQGVG